MRHLEIFNTVNVLSPEKITTDALQNLRYAGFLTLSQSGNDKRLINGIIKASKLGVSCINVVNVEDSPITRVIQEVEFEDTPNPTQEGRKLMRNDSGTIEPISMIRSGTASIPNAQFFENDENIGFYMKTGFCYSDVKSFIPQILAMALVAIWFSDKKTTVLDKVMKQRRKALVRDIELLPERINMTLTDEYLETYK
jgi:glucosamine 6-phosphate synthetase-like amidotransferase/phosphosugar isomerase protein